MIFVRKILVFGVLLLLPVMSFGQNSGLNNNVLIQKGIIYKNEFSVEAKLHTSGFSIGYNRGKISTYYLTKYYHFDIGYMKSGKEKKSNLVITSVTIFNTYAYGKRNYFFPVHLGMGMKKFLSEKQYYHGIGVGYSLQGGLTLGVLKPYFLVVKADNPDNGNPYKTIKYTEENRDLFIDANRILDRGSFFYGFTQLKMLPGIHLNGAIHYALKAYEKPLYAIETGVMIDAFIKRVPIMVETDNFKNKSVFINVYINVQIGNRWN